MAPTWAVPGLFSNKITLAIMKDSFRIDIINASFDGLLSGIELFKSKMFQNYLGSNGYVVLFTIERFRDDIQNWK